MSQLHGDLAEMLAVIWPKLAPLQGDFNRPLGPPGQSQGAAVVEIVLAEELAVISDLGARSKAIFWLSMASSKLARASSVCWEVSSAMARLFNTAPYKLRKASSSG